MSNEIKILGIDEAGRGPVIGPMIVAGFWIKDKSLISSLKKIKIKSSKLLSREAREKFYKIFLKLKKQKLIDFYAKKVPARKIDKYSLNYLFEEAILFLCKKYSANEIYIDAAVNPKGLNNYKRNLTHLIYKRQTSQAGRDAILIVCENFADENYPVVSAASIVAKVARDRAIKKLHKKYSCNFGSGYCHDKKTLKFLLNFYKQKGVFPKETRLKWRSFLEKIKKI